MPEFKKSKGFTMKGPTFFGSALKKYRKAPLKHDGSTPAGDMRHDHTPGDAGQAEEKKPMTSPQVEERETQPGDAGQMKMPESPTKGLKDILGKAKDKLSGGVGAGAGIGMMLGGPLGAAIGEVLELYEKDVKLKKKLQQQQEEQRQQEYQVQEQGHQNQYQVQWAREVKKEKQKNMQEN